MRHGLWLAILFGTSSGLLALTAGAEAAERALPDCAAAEARSVKLLGEHKLLDSRSELATCAASSCPTDIRDACTRQAAELTARVPTLTFDVENPSGKDLSQIAVTMDGRPLGEGLDKLSGVEFELDPGEHTFSFAEPGRPSVERRVSVREGDKSRERIAAHLFDTPSQPLAKEAPQTERGVLVQFYSPSDAWADGRWALTNKEHQIVCPFPCSHVVEDHSGLLVRRIPAQYGHEEEYYPLPDTLRVPPGRKGRLVVSKPRLLGTYGRWGAVFPILVGLPITIAGIDLLAVPPSSSVLSPGESVALGLVGTVLGSLLIGGGISWIVLARDPNADIVDATSTALRGRPRPFAFTF
jgi:hypothetical protein